MVRTFILSFIFISVVMYYSNQSGFENAQSRAENSRVLTQLQLKKQILLEDGKVSKAKLASLAFRTNISEVKPEKVTPKFKFSMELPKPNPQRNPSSSLVNLADDLVRPLTRKVSQKQTVKPKGLMQIVSRNESAPNIQVANRPKLEPEHWGRNELLRHHNRNTTQAVDQAYFHPTLQPNYSPSNASNVDVNDLYKTGVIFKGSRYRVVGLGQSRVDRRRRWFKRRTNPNVRIKSNVSRKPYIRLSSVQPRRAIQKKPRSEVKKIRKVRKKRRSVPKANKYSRRLNKRRGIDRAKKKRYVRQLPRKSHKIRKRRAARTRVVQKRIRKRVRRSKYKPVRDSVFGGLQF